MFARRRTATPFLLGAVAIAGAAALFGGGGKGPRAEITGAPLDPYAAASERAAFENLATFAGMSGGASDRPIAAAPSAAAGAEAAKLTSTTIAGIDLDKIVREGDVYVAPLANGKRVVLTLDPKLQVLAEKLLDESRAPRGAIVAMAPDGRILALAGRRTAEDTGSRTGTFDWRLATTVWAPAASIFKLVTASALVKAGVDPDGKVCFHGGLRSVLEHNLRDDKRDSRCENLTFGVSHSQNAILGKLAFQKLQPKLLEAQARLFGWTNPIAGDLDGLSAMAGDLSLPSTHDLEFARAAAGFTGAKLSVMGGALVAATFAGGGEQPAPRLIASIDGVAVTGPKPRRAIDASAARAVARMMVETCNSGSAAKTFRKGDRSYTVAGKTGTLTQNKPFYMEHSWFVGFAPANDPQIVVSVLLGNPESWHLRGHEAAKRLIDRALAPVKKPAPKS